VVDRNNEFCSISTQKLLREPSIGFALDCLKTRSKDRNLSILVGKSAAEAILAYNQTDRTYKLVYIAVDKLLDF
jgi:hypothetical protein